MCMHVRSELRTRGPGVRCRGWEDTAQTSSSSFVSSLETSLCVCVAGEEAVALAGLGRVAALWALGKQNQLAEAESFQGSE